MSDIRTHFTKDKNLKSNKNISIPTDDKTFYELTTPQKNIWNIEQFYSNTSINNVCGSVIIHEIVDFDKLKTAVDVMVKMNDAFGIEFINENDTIMQSYNKDILSNFSAEIVEVANKNELNDLENTLSHIVFDKNYLFDIKVFKLPNKEGGVICAIHHTLSDSWSIGLVSKYIVEIYYDLVQLKTLPTNLDEFVLAEKSKFKVNSYIDFIQKEADYLKSSSFSKDKKYWNNLFETVPDIPEFIPTINKNVNLPTASRESFKLSSDTLEKITNFCTNNAISVYNFLLAIYSVYISSVSNLDDFVVGTPVLNRRSFAEKSTIGMFISTMPLRINVDYNSTFTDFCKQISTNNFSAYRHQHYPYENLVSDLRKKHNNLSNLYNVLISYQVTKTISDNVNCESHWTFNGYSPDDLQIHISDLNDTGSLLVSYDYKNEKFEQAEIKKLHSRILHIIDTVLNNCNICLKNIDIVTSSEKDIILNKFNNTYNKYDKNETFAMMFEKQAEKTPNNIALVFGDQKLTFKELNEKANSLAYYLRSKKIGRDDIVGIMCNRSLELIISILAVLKSGGAYIPIDPHFPQDRVLYMLENSNAKLLLTQKVLDKVTNFDIKTNKSLTFDSKNINETTTFDNKIFVDLDENEIYDLPSDNLKPITKPQDLSYVIFTSGSTGKPKGVMLTSLALTNLTNYCNDYIEYLKKPSNMSVVSTTTVSFDIFIFETLISLQRGLKLVMANEDEQNTPSLLNALIKKHDVKVIQATPSRMQLFMNNLNDIPALKKLKYVTLAGEQLPSALVKNLQSLNNIVVYNGYGPSETTVFSTLTKMTGETVTIGKPLYNTQICILNHNIQLLPPGVPGEIYISGDGVGRGYINNEELTKKSFISTPYYNNKIMYKTGDLGFYTDDGQIICLGRADNQVKIRGQRIELGEIEEQISSISSIKNCVVVKKVDNNSHEFLCAYYTSDENVDSNATTTHADNVDCDTIKKYLEKKLPRYMIPQYFMQLSAIPYTPNGKVDRKALPNVNISVDEKDIVPARNDIDRQLIALFEDVLKVDNIGINSSFFDLGGDSLSAINLGIKIQSKFNVQLYANTITDNPIIQDLSDVIAKYINNDNSTNLIAKNINSDKSTSIVAKNTNINNSTNIIAKNINSNNSTNIINKIQKSDFYMTSNAQKRMYLASQIAGTSTLYNIPGCIILDSFIDSKLLEKCINIIINRHETLRTYFEMHDEVIVQKILDNVKFSLNVSDNVDFKDLQSIFDDFDKPFDLSCAPLFRAKLLNFTNRKSALLIDVHHIICDGTSISIFVTELNKLYNYYTSNSKSNIAINKSNIAINKSNKTENIIKTLDISKVLPKLDITYKDYSLHENNMLKSGALDEAKNYWLNTFKDEVPVLNMPTNFSRPSVQTFKGDKEYYTINSEIVEKINNLSKKLHITPYVLMLSAYYIMLSKYTNQSDIVVGSPVANRNILSTQSLIGMFVNTLALRINLNNDLSAKDFMLSLKDTVFDALKYEAYPFDELVNDLNLKKNTDRNPLFDVMFIYQNYGHSDFDFSGINSEYYIPNTHISKFDLSLEVLPINNEMKLTFEYSTLLFTNTFIKELITHYLNILNTILNNYNTKLSDICMLSESEKNKILYDFNKTNVEYDKTKTLSVLFENQAKKTPNNIALVFEDTAMTYEELNKKANSLAYHLRSIGVKRNDIIGIMCNRSLEMLISILAVLKAGGAYTPIDPTYPADRINYMLNTIGSKFLLTQQKLEKRVDFSNKLFVDLTSDIYNYPSDNLKNINSPDDLSYVIFTSGSTGRPKGVMLNHLALTNLANYCNCYIDYLKKPSNTCVVSTTTVSFDIFIFETLISLQRGLKLVIANENEQNTPSLLNKLIDKYDVKIIQATPSRMQLFVQNIDSFPALKKLKYITLAGEQLPFNLVDTLNKFGATIYNGYGPSETTVFSTLTKMDGDSVTIGKPLYNTQIYILDDNLSPVPCGVSGEIYISGDGVAKGYIKNDELTKKSFIKNPFVSGTLMYKSGDLGLYNEDGTITCLGRADNQIKIRGQRIELGEIEEQLLDLSYIDACVVVKKVDENTHEFLCAYFTSSIETVDLHSIRAHLEMHLPRYMVPQYFIKMDALPYTPNGKIDRKALPEPEYTHLNENIVGARNDIDTKLLELFKQILHITQISIDDSFFDLGGDSLSAINLASRIQSEFKAQLFVGDILENPTVQVLSDLISSKTKTNAKVTMIKPIEKSDFYKASSAQKRIYFTSQTDKNSTAYNIAGNVVFDGRVDADKLQDAFNTIIQRHESLRTSFALHDGEVVQRISDDIDFNLELADNFDFDNISSAFNEFVKPFNLEVAPLFRAKLVNCSNGKTSLFIDSHHIICDGVSISIFVDELCKLYNGESLDEINISYKDFANYECEKLVSGGFDNAKEYWVNKFKGEIPILNMPTIYSRPALQSFDGNNFNCDISPETVRKIHTLASMLNVTPYMIMLGAFYVLLSKYTSQNDIVVGTPVASRDIASTHNLIGMFVNTLALRENIETTLSFKSFIMSLKDDLMEAYKYQSYPFDELVNTLDIKKDLSRNPLFDVMFIYQNNGFRTFDFNGISSSYYFPDTATSKFDLTLEAVPENDKISINFEYSTKLFNKRFISSLAKHYLHILDAVLADCDVRISTISLLSVDEQKLLYDSVNNTYLKYPKDAHIIDLFEEQVAKTPDDIALIFEDKEYTYKELEQKVTCLANYIRKLPVYKDISKNDVRAIGIMLNRRAEILISMLAILKLGFAYLPIDPTYPEDRVSYIIDNSGIKIVLTETEFKDKFISNVNTGFDVEALFVDDDSCYDKYENFEIKKTPDDLAYLIYTSGSTGKPKGVMIKDSNVVNLIYSIRHIFPLKNKTVISITTMCFDIFVFESLLSVCSGVKIILTNNNEQNSPILLNELCKKYKVNMIQATPSKFNFLISDENNLDYIRNMKLIILTGEALPQSLLDKVSSIVDCKIFNMYGPTETTVWSTYKDLTEDKKVTIGKPIDNTQLYILDNDLNMLPKNVPGKLYIGGDGVTRGYLNRDELTAEKFIEYNGNIIYDTGDLAKINSKDEIECLGRTDFQVKVRGLRIELGEIEKQIASFKGVTEAVVIVKDINNRSVLCGYFVASGRVSTSLLRNKLSSKLPTYMVPTYLMQLNNFNHTPNGKIDRNSLPIPDVVNKEIVHPKNALQRRVLLIWKNILSIDEISIDDNFFEIGGDSLCALKLQLELMKANIYINYSDIFKNNTIESLCDFIENMKNSEPAKPIYHKWNFLKANMALYKNSKNRKLSLKQNEIKDVLLIGATGFLGIHVLAELLKIDNIKIYCLIRNDPSTSAENKLKNKFKYYFGSDLSNLFGTRIIVIPGEITENYFGVSKNTYMMLSNSVYTVINCAALVKHFGKYEDFEKINVTGVKNVATFCEKYGKTLFHASTISVSGYSLMAFSSIYNPNKTINFSEDKLFINQSLDNVYVRSKFEAEKFLLEEFANKKLRGIILRIGNVTNRFADGKFQENSTENAFNNRLKAFLYLKMIPKSIYNSYVEFTPVDILSESIIQTMKFYTPPMSVLHLYNSKHLYIRDFLKIAHELGIDIDVVDDEIFKENLKNILFNSQNYDKVSILLNDIDNDFNLLYKTNLRITNDFTLKFLDLAGFDWVEITKEYIKKIIDNL